MLGAEVKEWVTLTYFRHRENLHAGPGPALLRHHPSETGGLLGQSRNIQPEREL